MRALKKHSHMSIPEFFYLKNQCGNDDILPYNRMGFLIHSPLTEHLCHSYSDPPYRSRSSLNHLRYHSVHSVDFPHPFPFFSQNVMFGISPDRLQPSVTITGWSLSLIDAYLSAHADFIKCKLKKIFFHGISLFFFLLDLIKRFLEPDK